MKIGHSTRRKIFCASLVFVAQIMNIHYEAYPETYRPNNSSWFTPVLLLAYFTKRVDFPDIVIPRSNFHQPMW